MTSTSFDRELQILQLRATGLVNKEIAVHLNISNATVGRDIESVCERFNAKNVTHAVSIAQGQGLITSEATNGARSPVLLAMIAKHVIGHSNFDEFSTNDWENFLDSCKAAMREADELSGNNKHAS